MQHFLEQLDMQPKSNRLEHIDILKGLLIILVVIGHIGGIPTLHKYIYDGCIIIYVILYLKTHM